MTAERCQVEVGEPPGYWHTHRCTRPARFIDSAGMLLCTQHAKVADRRYPGTTAEPLTEASKRSSAS